MVDTLRVADWSDFIGQEALKTRLDVHINAARMDDRAMESVLLVGPPGFGKTALATIIANRLEVELFEFTMPIDDRVLQRVIIAASGVLMLDELHRASIKQQEHLLPLLEFGYVQDRRGIRHHAENLTIVAATTEPDKVINTIYVRFEIKPEFEDYTDEEMSEIVLGMASHAGIDMGEEMAEELGRATGGIPRRARQFILATRDLIRTDMSPIAADVLALCQVDSEGLTTQHLQYLKVLEANGGNVGLRTIQTILRLNEAVVRDLERLLVKKEFLIYTDRGRELSPKGIRRAALIA